MGRVTSLPEHRVQGASEHPRGGCCWASVGLTLQVTHPFPELLVISRAEQRPQLLSDQERGLEGSLPYRGAGTTAKATTARGRAGEQLACGRVTAPTFLQPWEAGAPRMWEALFVARWGHAPRPACSRSGCCC